MHPSSLLSYYPTYAILDEIVSKNNYKKIYIYIDLKNNLQSTYMEHAIINILENSKKSAYIDTSVFSAVVSFLSFHKIYGLKRGLDIEFVIFFESGKSSYHLNIDKNYKISRKIDDLYGLDREDKEMFFKVLESNYQLIEKTFNRIPKIKVIRLPRLEADFIPYYLLSRGKVQYDESVVHIIYSNDHDLFQCVTDHSYIFSKSGKHKKIISRGNVMKEFLKRDCDIPDSFLPLAMSVVGDVGDDVQGIKNVGPARFYQMFPELVKYTGNMGEIYNAVQKGEPIFKTIPEHIKNKYLKTVIEEECKIRTISKNLKLVSFELISRELDDPNSTEMLEKRKLIDKILNTNDEPVPCESLKKALEKLQVYLEESSLDFLYL